MTGTPDILSFKLAESDWDESLTLDEKKIHALVAGTRTINPSLLRLVKQWNPLFVAHGYAYISVEEGCEYNPSRRNRSWPVL